MPDQKPGPSKLTSARITLLILGALLVLIAISTWMGGLTSYQHLKEAADASAAGTTVQPAGSAPTQP